MKSVTLDTHKFILLLQEKGFSREQAEGLIEAVQQIDASELVTKTDLQLELAKSEGRLQKAMFTMLATQLGLFVAIMALFLDLI
jgi:PIN domain nuclease of toxin-antitoxin system